MKRLKEIGKEIFQELANLGSILVVFIAGAGIVIAGGLSIALRKVIGNKRKKKNKTRK